MGTTSSPVDLVYFGKLPARGDFVRSPSHAPLIMLVDQWLSQGLALMAQDARWKSVYDQASPLSFAFLGTGHRKAMAGHLMPSADLSGRRFPWVMVATFDVESPAGFVARAPLALQPLWTALALVSGRVREAEDPAPVLADYTQWRVEVVTAPQAHEAVFLEFLACQTVSSLQGLLAGAGHAVDLRQSILALGLLLEAVPARGRQPIDKGVRLPLPEAGGPQSFVAAFWLELISRFLRQRTDLELSVCLPRRPQGEGPTMFIGFTGGAPAQFSAMLDARGVHDAFVDIRQAAWAEAPAEQAFRTRKLSNYLRQPQLSLLQALRTFSEAFLGE